MMSLIWTRMNDMYLMWKLINDVSNMETNEKISHFNLALSVSIFTMYSIKQ